MKDKRTGNDLSPSICAESLEAYRKSDDSLAGLIERNHIEVRDFMILSFVCDQNTMDLEQISRVLDLSTETTRLCVQRLCKAGLVEFTDSQERAEAAPAICPTTVGRVVARRILQQNA